MATRREDWRVCACEGGLSEMERWWLHNFVHIIKVAKEAIHSQFWSLGLCTNQYTRSSHKAASLCCCLKYFVAINRGYISVDVFFVIHTVPHALFNSPTWICSSLPLEHQVLKWKTYPVYVVPGVRTMQTR